MRIEAVRRILPICWFNEATTEAGRDALGSITSARTRRATSGLVPIMIGQAMPLMRLV
jgi:phage terminase large subunit